MASRTLGSAACNPIRQAVRSVFIKWLSAVGDSLMDFSLVVDGELFINGSFQDVELGLLPSGSSSPVCVVKVAFDEPKAKWLSEAVRLVYGPENDCRIAIVVEIHAEPDENRPPPPEKEMWRSLPFMYKHNVGQLATTIAQFCFRKGYYLSGCFTCRIHVLCLRWRESELLWECRLKNEELILETKHDEQDEYPNWKELLLPEWTVRKKILLPFDDVVEAIMDSIPAYEEMVSLRMAGKKKKALLPPMEKCKKCRFCKRHLEPINGLKRLYEKEEREKEEKKRVLKSHTASVAGRQVRGTQDKRKIADQLKEPEAGDADEEMEDGMFDADDGGDEAEEPSEDEWSEYEDDSTDMTSD
ncbi:predicted protein [Uncinocarpus reesii 1704]|uniref:Uncharacterized protein n=1 Tax=Uncinocarpus reesii (strain UAMH 1704) TaxID=336963 RepID=C4JDS6_UNCRE|nr:uncharacterized protein UREG_00553 [Uncinocarpus reesii 1704]EEP75706.1 predicted protein [Uncinocarpus reesii 1704]